jgi:hypothetical protein
MMVGIQSPTTHRLQSPNRHSSSLSSHIMIMIISFIRKTKNFLDRFSKNNQTSDFMKIRPLGAEFFHANIRTY